MRKVSEFYGKRGAMNRDFDITFWQSQTSEARLRAGFQMAEDYARYKGILNELRLQRSVEAFQKVQR